MAVATEVLEAPVGAPGPAGAVRWRPMTPEGAGSRVRRYRRLRSLTQAQLAERSGTDKGYIGKLEAGGIDAPSIDVLERLALALEVPIRALADPRLYDDAGQDWESALMADPRFTEEEKQAILILGRAALQAKERRTG